MHLLLTNSVLYMEYVIKSKKPIIVNRCRRKIDGNLVMGALGTISMFVFSFFLAFHCINYAKEQKYEKKNIIFCSRF